MNIKAACLLLGYDLKLNARDTLGKLHRFGAFPFQEGSHAFFETREAVWKWTEEVNEIRRFQGEEGQITLLDFMRKETKS